MGTHCLKISHNVAVEFFFTPIFVLLKVTGLITLFDRKRPLKNVKVARFPRNFECDFFL